MAVRAAGPLAPLDAIAESCVVLTMDLLRASKGQEMGCLMATAAILAACRSATSRAPRRRLH